MKTVPFWTDDFPRPAALTSASLPATVDVAIVGSGYTGLCAARVLAKHGAKVGVLERHTIGWGASSRNGGLSTTGMKQSAQQMVRRYGDTMGRAFWQASLDAIDLIGEIVADEGIDCDFRRKGHIALAYKASHFDKMRKSVPWFREKLNHTLHLVSRSELRSEIGTDLYYGGIVDEWSAGLHPAKYVFGLAEVVQSYGVLLCEKTDVKRLELKSNGFNVHTSQGVMHASQVLVATNGYTDMLIPQLKPRLFPVGSYIIVTEPLSLELQKKLSPKGRMFYDSKNFLNYFRLTPDGRILFGGRNDLSTDLDLADSARKLRRQMLRVFPELKSKATTHSWSGRLGITFDLMPHIGRIGGIHYALGYGGHGVSIASYVGTEVGLLLSGQKMTSPFVEIPHPTRFFYRGKPWFVPWAARYYRLLDRFT